MSTNWTFGGTGQYTASWDGASSVTVTQTAGGAFVLSFAARSLEAALAAPDYQALVSQPPGSPGLSLVATTGVNGFALQNATPNIISWTAPSDGNMHRAFLIGGIHVTATETGGAVVLNVTQPDGSTSVPTVFAAGQATGSSGGATFGRPIGAGTAITLAQSSALTAGAAVLWAEIWAA